MISWHARFKGIPQEKIVGMLQLLEEENLDKSRRVLSVDELSEKSLSWGVQFLGNTGEGIFLEP